MDKEETQELAKRLLETAEEFEKCSPGAFLNNVSVIEKRSPQRDDAARALVGALRLLESNCTYRAAASAIHARVAAYEAKASEINAGKSAPQMDIIPGDILTRTARLYACYIEQLTAEREKPAADVLALIDHARAAAKQANKLLNAYRFGLDEDKVKAWKVAAQALADDLQELYTMLPGWGRDVLPGTYENTRGLMPRKGDVFVFLTEARNNSAQLSTALGGMAETLEAVAAILIP